MLSAISYDPLVRIHLGPRHLATRDLPRRCFLVGARLLLGDTRRRGISDDDMYAILARAGIGALVGARVVYVVKHWSVMAGLVLVQAVLAVAPFGAWRIAVHGGLGNATFAVALALSALAVVARAGGLAHPQRRSGVRARRPPAAPGGAAAASDMSGCPTCAESSVDRRGWRRA